MQHGTECTQGGAETTDPWNECDVTISQQAILQV